MAYTSRQHEAQRRIQAAIGLANAAGLCVVCMRRPQATWPDLVYAASPAANPIVTIDG